TPLLLAISNGYKAVVKLLLIRDNIDPNSEDKFGAILLLLAAEYRTAAEHGHEVIVKLLLIKDSISLNSTDIKGWTPLL
ncbi:uncharacterized protein K441DRAFT_549574, partial [Cenococcum geophilum 1.58]|uniref:uncharacterized protein n=1 Tax=Cenococcum geophilum 1.58 TaxID=794803 RepID=UPI00358E0214